MDNRTEALLQDKRKAAIAAAIQQYFKTQKANEAAKRHTYYNRKRKEVM